MVNAPVENIDRLAEYLLGKLDEGAAVDLEDRYFRDSGTFDLLNAALDNLTDAYVSGSMAPADRPRFAQRYLRTSADRARVEFARTLQYHRAKAEVASAPRRTLFFRAVFDLAQQQSAPLRFALAAAVLILIAAPTLTISKVGRLSSEVGALRAALQEQAEAARVASTEAAREKERRQALEETLVGLSTSSFALVPGTDRGAGTTLAVPKGPGYTKFEFALENVPSLPLRVIIQTSDHASVWSEDIRDSVSSGGPVVRVPSSILPPGEYLATIIAKGGGGRTEELARYGFRIVWR